MKLTRAKLMETIRRKNEGWTTYQARKIAGVSIRRVNQVYSFYLKTELVPEIGRNNGRPIKPFEEWEMSLVKEAWPIYRVSADTLERILDQKYGRHIAHNRLHRIMLMLGFGKAKQKKDIRKKKWIRYQRKHSLTAVHIDWHYGGKNYVFAVIDDASRKILALLETGSATTDFSIKGMKLALRHGKIRQCISDHGAQFICNIDGDSRFKTFLVRHGIKQILCRIKHPQSNGKIEKWFDCYDNHRHAFQSRKAFLHWYNEIRPHRSLDFSVLETPGQAFIRKMKAEA